MVIDDMDYNLDHSLGNLDIREGRRDDLRAEHHELEIEVLEPCSLGLPMTTCFY